MLLPSAITCPGPHTSPASLSLLHLRLPFSLYFPKHPGTLQSTTSQPPVSPSLPTAGVPPLCCATWRRYQRVRQTSSGRARPPDPRVQICSKDSSQDSSVHTTHTHALKQNREEEQKNNGTGGYANRAVAGEEGNVVPVRDTEGKHAATATRNNGCFLRPLFARCVLSNLTLGVPSRVVARLLLGSLVLCSFVSGQSSPFLTPPFIILLVRNQRGGLTVPCRRGSDAAWWLPSYTISLARGGMVFVVSCLATVHQPCAAAGACRLTPILSQHGGPSGECVCCFMSCTIYLSGEA